MSDDGAVLAEQFKRAIDKLQDENDRLRSEKDAEIKMINYQLAELRQAKNDHEQRIRTIQDGVTSFKVWSGMANGGAGLLSLFALLRTFLIPGG